jgi:hypothetical protein
MTIARVERIVSWSRGSIVAASSDPTPQRFDWRSVSLRANAWCVWPHVGLILVDIAPTAQAQLPRTTDLAAIASIAIDDEWQSQSVPWRRALSIEGFVRSRIRRRVSARNHRSDKSYRGLSRICSAFASGQAVLIASLREDLRAGRRFNCLNRRRGGRSNLESCQGFICWGGGSPRPIPLAAASAQRYHDRRRV